jgi:hypothetical protein
MHRTILALLAFLAATFTAIPGRATPDGNAVLQVTSVYELSQNTLTNYSAAYVGAYYCTAAPCPTDGGEGYFQRKGGACPTVDGGRTIQDLHPACWYRQNLNGDLRQWGITTNSVYDAANTPVGSLQAADGIIRTYVIPALRDAGIRTIHTGQVSILLQGQLTLDAGWSLTCDTPRVINPANVDFSVLPGSIVLGHQTNPLTAVLNASNDDVEIHDCAAIIPEWYKNPAAAVASTFGGYARDDAGPVKYTELEAIRANMVLASDTAITAGPGANIHDLSILGFDNCVNLSNGPGFIAKNLSLDCDVGLYLAHENGISTVKDVFNIDYLTKGTASLSHGAFPNEEYWSIASIAPDGSGECELSLASVPDPNNPGNPLFSVQEFNNLITYSPVTHSSGTNASLGLRADPNFYPAWVTGPGVVPSSCLSAGTGQFGNDAAWPIHVVTVSTIAQTAVIDLIGSKYTTANSGMSPVGITAHADWSANTSVIHITDSIANLTPGMTVTSSGTGFPAGAVTVAGIVQRCTGPDPNDGYNGCIVLSAPTTAATTTTAALTFYSAPLSSGNPCDGTGQLPCLFLNPEERYVSGLSAAGTASSRLPSSRLGHLGAGFLLDSIAGLRAINTDSYAHYYNIAAIDAAACDFVELKGDDNGELNPGNTTGIYLAGSSRGCVFESHGPGKPAASLVEDTYGSTDNNNTGSGALPLTANSFSLTAGTVTLTSGGTNASWTATRGTMHVCSATISGTGTLTCDTSHGHIDEYLFYHKTGSTTSFALDQRGRLGSFPQDFTTAGMTVTLFSTSVNSGSSKHVDKSAATVFSDLDASTTPVVGNQFEVLHGAVTFRNVDTLSGGIGFVSTNAAGTTIIASDMPMTSVVFEDDTARAATTISSDSSFATFVKPGALLQPLSYGQYFGSPQALTIPAMSGNPISSTYLGELNVQDTTNWPQTGVIQVDSEFLAFHIENSTRIIIDQRGLCGSAAASHAASSMASYMNVLWGCPLLTSALPQFAMDDVGNVFFAQSNLAHGQVYMSLNSVAATIQLCPSGGKGLIISGVMRTIPSPCAIVPTSQATAMNTVYYVYAVYHQVAVTSIVGFGSPPHARLFVTDNTDFYTGTPITCIGITGTSGTNVVEDNQTTPSVSGPPYIDILDKLTTGSPSGTGACSYIGLEFDTNGHVTDQYGVEVDSATGGGTKTLVGIVATDGMSTINDILTKRDVASWFNRRQKKMLVPLGTNSATTTETTYHTPSGHTVEGEFVALAQPNQGGVAQFPTVQWNMIASATVNMGTVTAGIAACFSTSSLGTDAPCPSPGNEPEVSLLLPVTTSGTFFSTIGLAGNPSGPSSSVTEGRNYMDILMQTNTHSLTLTLQTNGAFIDAYLLQ